ncbi:hypothetical protein SpCBS45565_g01637 [Spizellomyces sp. 'palustris']|nr:hypothetical protein SpCBS45565_g01637 [Spizellomyces sp. 'palustris']
MVFPDKLKRLFIQAYLLERFSTEEDVLNVYQRVCETLGRPYVREDLSSFISSMNQTLDTIDMELRRGHAPRDGTTYYALVNTNGDEVAKMATECTPTEITYFKHLIEIIVHADDDVYELSSTVALSEATRIKPAMAKRDAEAFIDRMIKNKWLVDRDGLISMSLRTILELQTYLKDQYPDRILECTLCMEIVTTDYERCNVANCQTRLHSYCSRQYFSRRNQNNCPSCQSEWRGILLGTGEHRAGNTGRRASRRVSASQSTLSLQRDEEEEQEDDENVIMNGTANDSPEDMVVDRPLRRTRDRDAIPTTAGSSRKRPRRPL